MRFKVQRRYSADYWETWAMTYPSYNEARQAIEDVGSHIALYRVVGPEIQYTHPTKGEWKVVE